MNSAIILMRPWFLLLLLPLLLIWWWRQRQNHHDSPWQKWIDPHLLPFLTSGNRPQQKRRWYSLLLIWVLATLALSGPSLRRQHEGNTYLHDSAQVLLLDLSPSMQADDVKPSRLARAKLKAIDWLKRHPEGQTALVVYSGSAHIVVPFSTDTRTISALLPTLDTSLPPVTGNDPAQAFQLIERMRRDSGVARVDVTWFTDGFDDDQVTAISAAIAPSNLRLSIMAVGSNAGAPVRLGDNRLLTDNKGQIVLAKVDHGLLMRFAQQHGARYAPLQADDHDLKSLEWPLQQSDTFRDAETVSLQWLDIGGWLCVALLPLVMWSLRRASVYVLLPLFLLQAPRSDASWWQDLWQTADQQGAEAMAKGDNASAAQLFQRPDWRGTAQYRNGKFADAAADFSQQTDLRNTFNRANALAYAQKYQEAEKAFELALKIDPGHKPAQENLAALREFMKQQSQQQAGKDGQQDKLSQQKDGGNDKSPPPSSQSSQESTPTREPGEQSQAQKDNDELADSKSKKTEQSAQEAIRDGEQQKKDKPDKNDSATLADENDKTKTDPQVEALLRQLPDDPSGLLRRRMKLELMRRGQTEPETQQQNKW